MFTAYLSSTCLKMHHNIFKRLWSLPTQPAHGKRHPLILGGIPAMGHKKELGNGFKNNFVKSNNVKICLKIKLLPKDDVSVSPLVLMSPRGEYTNKGTCCCIFIKKDKYCESVTMIVFYEATCYFLYVMVFFSYHCGSVNIDLQIWNLVIIYIYLESGDYLYL